MSAPLSAGTALITGASAGIGAVYADRLAARGHDLILVARNQDRLRGLATVLTGKHRRSVRTVPADLTRRVDLAAVEEMLKTDPSITTLVNNAGVAALTPLLASDPDKMEELIALNVTAATRLVYAAVPGFVERGGGTVINIGSVVAIGPEILNGVYGASKAFVLALSQSLQHEVAGRGVRVQAVLPGATATDIWALAGKPVEQLDPSIVMSAEDMVDAALAGLDAGEVVTLPALADAWQWEAYETARRTLLPNLSRARPAERYRRAS